MRLTYLLPGPMHATALGEHEMRRRAGILTEWAGAGTTVTVSAVASGPASVESAYEEYLAIPAMGAAVRAAEADGSDAVVLGCFGDPGLDGLREIADRPVVGPAGAAMSLAVTLGRRFAIVTVARSIVGLLHRLAWETGVHAALDDVRAVDVPVIALNEDHEHGVAAVRAECERVLADGSADTIVLGCMSMGFLGAAERLTAQLGVPVINPARVAVHHAQALHHMGLSQSRRAYHLPPKVAAGAAVDDLSVTAAGPAEITT